MSTHHPRFSPGSGSPDSGLDNGSPDNHPQHTSHPPGQRRTTLLFALLTTILALTAAPAMALPEGREYEQVSPQYKGGYGATFIEGVSQDGESVAFFSPGAFNGAPAGLSSGIDSIAYLARRGPSGWSTAPEMPPDTLAPTVTGSSVDLSPTLGSVLVLAKLGPNNTSAVEESTQQEFLLHATGTPDLGEDWNVVGALLEPTKPPNEPFTVDYAGGSRDFCHLLIQTTEPLLPEAGVFEQLYELARGCGGEPSELKLVALNNEGRLFSPACRTARGIEGYPSNADAFNATADEGDETFFTTCISNKSSDYQLFVRLGGARTVEVSKPLAEAEGCAEAVPCNGAVGRASTGFAGASEDGSRVFFTTRAQLVPGDTDTSNQLYMASIGCPPGEPGCEASRREVTSLVQVAQGSAAACGAVCQGNGEVQGVVRVAPDGERVYFVARGVLSGEPGPEGRLAVRGADNLYVYDGASGRVSFIGDLCSGHDLSGSVSNGGTQSGGVEDQSCPSGTAVDTPVWEGGIEGSAKTAGVDGRFLVFTSYAQLTADDTDMARDVYRYDAVAGTLERVSIGEDGYDANGNNDAFDASLVVNRPVSGTVRKQYELTSRAVSEDGSRIVFVTSEPLSPGAINGLPNAYEWHEGKVSLVSSGSAETPVEDVVISPSGNDVFFVTSQGLVAQDTDGASDVYDAHLCSAGAPCFAPAAAGRRPCEGDACQGPLTNPAPLLVPGSVAQEPGGNLPALMAPPARARAVKSRVKPATCRRGFGKKRGRCVSKSTAKGSTRRSR
jgi:hypothetical protein